MPDDKDSMRYGVDECDDGDSSTRKYEEENTLDDFFDQATHRHRW